MTIRTKLLIFIPLLVLLVGSVSFFLYQSGKLVQQSYHMMMDRLLLYKSSVRTTDDTLNRLYIYLLNPNDSSRLQLKEARFRLRDQRAALEEQLHYSHHAAALENYVHMVDTFMEQEQAAFDAAQGQTPRSALALYAEAEKTAGFIREDGQLLVDQELDFYQPVYQRIQAENNRMNRLGAAVFVINTLMSILIAVWISRSVTGPVNRLVARAKQISKGELKAKPSPFRASDELGALSEALEQMSNDLSVFIEKDKASLEKDRLVKELELHALQSQINPHFLFNTLNVLSKLALLEGAERTSDLIVSMSNLLRYNLRNLDQPVTLQDEVRHVQAYFKIQQARFRDRVRLELDIDHTVLRVPIPALTLQPLVENAFLHGIEQMESGAMIRLGISRSPEGVSVSVTDNGRGMSGEERLSLLRLEAGTDNKQSTGLGTRNVFKRLQLFYDKPAMIDIKSEPGKGATVTILIPEQKEGEQAYVPTSDRG
ncbi:sensor histidine kinase [Paenibacillus harenae]|uniref:sensor histidine kinase n=1 Tax=Paenibacillus harenae TaxID=306543 RepID=UPI000412C3B9|nr:histidine kinase [Paenibacillus harenae]